MIPAVVGLAKMGVGIIDKLVVDKNKKAELAYRWNERMLEFAEKLVLMNTVPWVDATVKLMTASLIFMRPVGSFVLTLMGIDMAVENGEVGLIEGGLMSLFPGWMGARQIDKHSKKKKVVVKQDEDDEDWGW